VRCILHRLNWPSCSVVHVHGGSITAEYARFSDTVRCSLDFKVVSAQVDKVGGEFDCSTFCRSSKRSLLLLARTAEALPFVWTGSAREECVDLNFD